MADDDLLALAEVRKHPERYRGETGEQGKRGLSGVTGPKGPQGDPGLTWRGEWNKRTAYVKDDAVESDGSSWVAKAPNTGSKPPSGSWDLLARKGNDGAQGATGHTGMAGIPISDEGIPKGVANGLNFVGSGVVASMNALGGADVSVSGGGGGGGGTVTISETDPGATGAYSFWLETTEGADPVGNYNRLWIRNASDTDWAIASPVSFTDSGQTLVTSPGDNAELNLLDGVGSYLVSPDDMSIQGGNGAGLLFFDSAGVHLGANGSAPKLGALSDAVPLAVNAVPSAGTGTKASREDHIHQPDPSGIATDPGDIVDPLTVTPEEVALAYNTLLANLRSAGMIA